MEHFAFESAVEFELRLRLLDTSLKRQLRVKYRYTPEWPHFDPATNNEITAPSILETELEFKLPQLPAKKKGKPDPYAAVRDIWTEWRVSPDLLMLGLINPYTDERLFRLIDSDARSQDVARRRAADPNFPDPGDAL